MSTKQDLEQELKNNTMNYLIADIEGKEVFLHEATWVLGNKKPIPTGKLVYHIDGNPMNNDITNLGLVDENKEYGDLHQASNKIFHEQNIFKYEKFIEDNFDDIYEVIFKIVELPPDIQLD